MIAPSSNHLSMPGSASGGTGAALAGGTGAALAGAAFASSATLGGAGEFWSSSTSFKCVSFMRHSIATHNEAAATSSDPMELVYLSEAYADSSLSHRGRALVRGARQSMVGLSPAPCVVLCSPLTRAIQTAIAMFGGTGTRIVAVPEAREAYGRFPCDRHRDRSELELMFGDSVDFSLCDVKDMLWTSHHREEMSHLNGRVERFVDRVLRRDEGHVFVVSHGVFMEAAIEQLTCTYPGHGRKNRVHNCEVHSFVFSTTPPRPSSAPVSTTASPSGAAAITTAFPPTPPPSAMPSSITGHTATTNASGVGGAAASIRGGELHMRPRVEAYLAGQGLALACAVGMPLPAVAHVNRVFRRFSADGRYLTEAQLSGLLARCGLGAQEIRWLYCALDREGGGKVASGDFLLALMAFYSRDGGEAVGATARVRLMDLRMRYQREMYGTPLANYELLEATFNRILSTVLATP